MESIKHKMDTMVKEKDAAIEKAMGFEAETEELNKARFIISISWSLTDPFVLCMVLNGHCPLGNR